MSSNDTIGLLFSIRARQANLKLVADTRKKLQRRTVRWRRLLLATLALLVALTAVRYGQNPQAPVHMYEDQVKLQQLFDSIR